MPPPLMRNALRPFFNTWNRVVGPEIAAKTRVAVIGGLHLQAKKIRNTQDIDVIVKSGVMDRFQIRNKIVDGDSRFRTNFEKRCGVTFRDKPDHPITPIDIIDEEIAFYMPEGMLLSEVVQTNTIPFPTDSEAIIMKLLAASDRLRMHKAMEDFEDAMQLLKKLNDKGTKIEYKDSLEKEYTKKSFDRFYPHYKEAKEATGEIAGVDFWDRDDWELFLRLSD